MLNILPNSIDESNLDLLTPVNNIKRIIKIVETFTYGTEKVAANKERNVHHLYNCSSTHLHGKSIISIILCIKVLEANIIPFWVLIIEARVHIALHLVKQVQIIHQLMKYMTSTALAASFISFNQF